jgi:CHAT domain-containing protein/tetratricopeptide (TPR) repeat protein
MPMRRFCSNLALTCVLVFVGVPTLGSVRAQSDEELKALNQRVIELYRVGKYTEAIPLAERYADAVKARHGPDHPDVATALNNLAALLEEINRLSEAEALLRRALAIDQKSLGPEHPKVATDLNNLALLLKAANNRVAEAEPLMRRALAIDEKSLGPEHSDVARDLNNLAQLLQDTNRLAEAEPLMRRGLSIAEKRFGPQHPNIATALSNLAELLRATNRLAEAEPLCRRALAINEKRFGPEHPKVATAINNLAELLRATNRLAEAEPLYHRALAIDEKSLGPEHSDVARDLNNLAGLLRATNRLAEAEPLYRRALAIDEKSFGTKPSNVAIDLNNVALLFKDTDRLAEAEPLMRRALSITEQHFGPEHPKVATTLNNLAALLQDTNRLAEAEPLYRRALAIDEKSFGPEHPEVATALNNLAALLQATNRLSEAEPLMRRALAIDEKSFGPEHPAVATGLSNLALLLKATHRLSEAEPLMRRALAIHEKNFGREHPAVATDLNNLALLLKATNNRFAEAELLYRRALAIDEKSFGSDHPSVATELNNLARLMQDTNRVAEAEPLMRRALAIDEKSFGPEHPNVARDLNNLAALRAERGDWTEAAALGRRAKPALIARKIEEGGDRTGIGKAALASNTWALRRHARAQHRAGAGSAAARQEGFELAQWALQTGAADALAQMSVRFAKGAGPLASLVRERQDLFSRRQADMRRLDAAAGRADASATQAARAALVAVEEQIDAIDARLAVRFPEYSELANPKPLTLAEVRTLLRPDEALVAFLDVPKFAGLPEESLAWVVTKDTVRWRSIALGTSALSERVAALRCGLDTSSWDDALGWPQVSALDKQRAAEQQARRDRCKQLLGLEVSSKEWPPFDLVKAHELYQALLAPFADLTKDKQLIIVPSGPLTSLPFHVLVTDKPDSALTGMARYQKAAWLALQQPVTVLPSVGSLQALRKLGPSQAAEPYIAFGDPLLTGPSGSDKRAWDRQTCGQDAKPTRLAEARGKGQRGVALRAIDLAELRTQEPLPETADELCAVAAALGAVGRESDTIWLGERATERNLKRLSREGKLRSYKIVHFATHGLLSGESEAILKAKAEPALILTPPKDGTPASELEEDDGLLSASEIAQLELDADWVVLSACNTAAGDNGDAEALSGLARAFFYAKARALLVSHWPVNSDAAVKLTTRVFQALKSNPSIGRAEALRRSMVELITGDRPQDGERATKLQGRGFDPQPSKREMAEGRLQDAHPAMWAPFVLVGEGAR